MRAAKTSSVWKDGDTWLNSTEDRVGALLVGIFAAILGRYIFPELLKYRRSR